MVVRRRTEKGAPKKSEVIKDQARRLWNAYQVALEHTTSEVSKMDTVRKCANQYGDTRFLHYSTLLSRLKLGEELAKGSRV